MTVKLKGGEERQIYTLVVIILFFLFDLF